MLVDDAGGRVAIYGQPGVTKEVTTYWASPVRLQLT